MEGLPALCTWSSDLIITRYNLSSIPPPTTHRVGTCWSTTSWYSAMSPLPNPWPVLSCGCCLSGTLCGELLLSCVGGDHAGVGDDLGDHVAGRRRGYFSYIVCCLGYNVFTNLLFLSVSLTELTKLCLGPKMKYPVPRFFVVVFFRISFVYFKTKVTSRDSTSRRVTEVSLMFLEMGEPREWGQLAS